MKKFLNFAGVVITFVSLFFLYSKYSDLESQGAIDVHQFSIPIFLSSALLYILAVLLLCLSWRNILSSLSHHLRLKDALAIYGVSQIGKYAPGNVFHFIGKQILGGSYNVPSKKMVKSQFFELVIQAISSFPFIIYLILNVYAGGSDYLCVVAFFITIVTLLVLISWYKRRFAISFCLYFLFLVVCGSVFYSLLNGGYNLNYGVVKVITVICAFSTAWFIGFIIPGAPAGIGVRESALIIFLIPLGIPENTILECSLFFRLISVFGDFCFFVFAFFLHILRKDVSRHDAA